jgi:hypothetical protein
MVVFGGWARTTVIVAILGPVAIITWVAVGVATAPSEPVHETEEFLGHYVSPYLWFVVVTNALGWYGGLLAGWGTRRAARRTSRAAKG